MQLSQLSDKILSFGFAGFDLLGVLRIRNAETSDQINDIFFIFVCSNDSIRFIFMAFMQPHHSVLYFP
jgi:hypothetical protein